jgi:septal ring factor EnvC (AmiA/AmiB activator)
MDSNQSVRESQFQSLSLYCSVTHFDQTTMDDQLRQVQEEIAETKRELDTARIEATKADLTEAERERKDDLVLALTNLLVRLYAKKARVEARLSAGEIYITIEAYAIFCGFFPPMFMISYYPIFIYMSPS